MVLLSFAAAVASAQESKEQLTELAQIKRVGLALFMYANDNEGIYPESVAVLKGDYGLDDSLLFDKVTGKPKWLVTPGLRTSDRPDKILLQSSETREGGKAIYYVGGSVGWIKEGK